MKTVEQAGGARRVSWLHWGVAALVFGAVYLASVGPYVALPDQRAVPQSLTRFFDEVVYFPILWADINTQFFYENGVCVAYGRSIEWCEAALSAP